MSLDGPSQQSDSAKEASPAHQAAGLNNQLWLERKDPPAWVHDRIVTGSDPESMRIAVVRQLSRLVGIHLAELTLDDDGALKLLQTALLRGEQLPLGSTYHTLRDQVIQGISEAKHHEDATFVVLRLWQEQITQAKLQYMDSLVYAVAVTKLACHEALSLLLSKPESGQERVSGDLTLRTVFGHKGDVDKIYVTQKAGKLSSALARHLKHAAMQYQQQREDVLEAGLGVPVPTPIVSEVIHSQRGGKEPQPATIYKVTSAEFITAYHDSLLEYAATKFAARWRDPTRPKKN
jgi:hypothetical protein